MNDIKFLFWTQILARRAFWWERRWSLLINRLHFRVSCYELRIEVNKGLGATDDFFVSRLSSLVMFRG